MKTFVFLFGFLCIMLLSVVARAQVQENLDEMFARKARISGGNYVFNVSLLENSSNNYIWQPETLMYKDVTTGHEVWVLVHQPNKQDIYSKEPGTEAWSYDGSRIGFYSAYWPISARPTNNPALSNNYHSRWIVNADGSGLRNLEGYGRNEFPHNGFNWAHTELAYYSFGSGPAEGTGSATYKLYKMTLNSNNVATGNLVLDTSSVNTFKKDMIAGGITIDDSRAVFRDYTSSSWPTPNPILTTGLYFADLKGTPTLKYAWGVARHIGPSTNNWADPYGDHTNVTEDHFHGISVVSLNGSVVSGGYSGSAIGVFFKDHGSASDGGPLWQDWNGTSFGNDEIRVWYDGAGTPDNPYGMMYVGHGVWDNWGHYLLFANYNDIPRPGMMIYDYSKLYYLSNYPMQYNAWISNHHSWTGWTDWPVAVRSDTYAIETNKWDATTKPGDPNFQTPITVAYTHHADPNTNYNAYPRPSESPDGTKVAFAQYFLNGGQGLPYIAWAVVYYPYPPTNLSASYSGGVRLTWLPPKYTTRGWPNETADPAPYAREIKRYHVWRSSAQSGPWQEIASVNATYHVDNYYGLVHDTANLYFTDNPGDGTYYYALTSEENSGLESDELSEILQVTVSGGAITGQQIVQPKGQKNFWASPSSSPYNFQANITATPSQYRLSWSEPSDPKIRYYNIYYSNNSNPPADQQHRIASVPAGFSSYMDWLADPNTQGYYGITSVDRYGNEGIITLAGGPSCIHNSEIPPCDGCVEDFELTTFIDKWKVNSSDVTLRELIEAIGLWKRGC